MSKGIHDMDYEWSSFLAFSLIIHSYNEFQFFVFPGPFHFFINNTVTCSQNPVVVDNNSSTKSASSSFGSQPDLMRHFISPGQSSSNDSLGDIDVVFEGEDNGGQDSEDKTSEQKR